MKSLLMALLALGSIQIAHASKKHYVFEGDISGIYNNGDFRVLQSRTGKLSLVDTQLGKVYSANALTGEAAPFDIVDSLKESRNAFIRENAKYIKAVTVAVNEVIPGRYQYEIRATVSMPLAYTSGTFDAVLVFDGNIVGYSYDDWDPYTGYTIHRKAITSNLNFARLEDPTRNSANSMLFAGLSLLMKLYPNQGINAWLSGTN